MKEVHDVSVGRVVVSGSDIVLRSVALGSCIGIACYDSQGCIGGLSHIMLPGRAPDKAVEKTRYADNAIREMIEGMIRMGAQASRIGACLVGAGNVLQKPHDTICRANIDSVTGILESMDIPVHASLLGGVQRKSISLNVETGHVFAAEGDDKESLLWEFVRK